MKRFKRGEKGFTLVELLVAIPIIGLLGLAAGAVLMQLLRSDNISNRMAAVREVQVAGDRVGQDGIQAQSVEFGDEMTSDPYFLRLHWSGQWMEGTVYVSRDVYVEYYLDETADGFYNLKRREWLNADPTEDPTVESIVARHLDAGQMSCEWAASDNNSIAFKAVSVVGTKTEERIYNISPRSLG